ncbi:hypothetical protein CY34DRAFT_800675 [Suillus luteus UH-Slu-Lm8-n1]|uniref:Uncharacterized protein n=1 Tax=Suillus luteus UH-Slu-Lm8-n1 TaxID=930992 RepID=A0A0D0BT07_9AGAM|nr:hypothetical protein CY34DRAFT_800675 [Suillus luteus UH-Slu-Lm8-n1]
MLAPLRFLINTEGKWFADLEVRPLICFCQKCHVLVIKLGPQPNSKTYRIDPF